MNLIKALATGVVATGIAVGMTGVSGSTANAHIADTERVRSSEECVPAENTETSTITYDNSYWGISRVSGTYLTSSGSECFGTFRTEKKSIDTGILAVYMDRTISLPKNAFNIYIDVYLDGSSFPTERYFVHHVETHPIVINSSGTVFNPSVWLSRE